MLSLGQDEPLYTYTDHHTRHFIREGCYGGRIATNIQEFNSSICTGTSAILQKHSKSNSKNIFKLTEEFRRCIDVFEEEVGNQL